VSHDPYKPGRTRPRGVTAVALFFVFGAFMSALAAVMLLFPHSVLEPLWRINPRGHEGFVRMGAGAIVLMVAVCAACATAAAGLWRMSRVGYVVALVILVVNIGGDLVNSLALHDWRTILGAPVGGAMIWYLVRQRGTFRNSTMRVP
jgi:hypothetical protein